MALKPRKEPQVSDQQRAFVDHWLTTGCKVTAAKLAGYKSARDNADNIYKSAGVQHEILRRQSDARERGPLVEDYVRTGIVEVVERAMAPQPMRDKHGKPVLMEVEGLADEDGNPVRVAMLYRFQPDAALRGLEMLGRTLGMFEKAAPKSGEKTISDLIAAIQQATGRPLSPSKAPIRSQMDGSDPRKPPERLQ